MASRERGRWLLLSVTAATLAGAAAAAGSGLDADWQRRHRFDLGFGRDVSRPYDGGVEEEPGDWVEAVYTSPWDLGEDGRGAGLLVRFANGTVRGRGAFFGAAPEVEDPALRITSWHFTQRVALGRRGDDGSYVCVREGDFFFDTGRGAYELLAESDGSGDDSEARAAWLARFGGDCPTAAHPVCLQIESGPNWFACLEPGAARVAVWGGGGLAAAAESAATGAAPDAETLLSGVFEDAGGALIESMHASAAAGGHLFLRLSDGRLVSLGPGGLHATREDAAAVLTSDRHWLVQSAEDPSHVKVFAAAAAVDASASPMLSYRSPDRLGPGELAVDLQSNVDVGVFLLGGAARRAVVFGDLDANEATFGNGEAVEVANAARVYASETSPCVYAQLGTGKMRMVCSASPLAEETGSGSPSPAPVPAAYASLLASTSFREGEGPAGAGLVSCAGGYDALVAEDGRLHLVGLGLTDDRDAAVAARDALLSARGLATARVSAVHRTRHNCLLVDADTGRVRALDPSLGLPGLYADESFLDARDMVAAHRYGYVFTTFHTHAPTSAPVPGGPDGQTPAPTSSLAASELGFLIPQTIYDEVAQLYALFGLGGDVEAADISSWEVLLAVASVALTTFVVLKRNFVDESQEDLDLRRLDEYKAKSRAAVAAIDLAD